MSDPLDILLGKNHVQYAELYHKKAQLDAQNVVHSIQEYTLKKETHQVLKKELHRENWIRRIIP